MSGGHWDYDGFKIQDVLERVGADPAVIARFPRLAALLPSLGRALARVEHTLDWDLSHDSEIENDARFEAMAIDEILGLVSKG